jgi:hypothetical protein
MRSGFLTQTEETRNSRICEEAKAALGTTVVFGGADQRLIGEDSLLQDVRADTPAGFAESFSFDLLLVDVHGGYDVPLVTCRGAGCARTPTALLLRVSDEVTVDMEPYGRPFPFSLERFAGIRFTGTASVPQMPPRLLPGGLRFAHLSVQLLLGAPERCLGGHDHPPFAPLW